MEHVEGTVAESRLFAYGADRSTRKRALFLAIVFLFLLVALLAIAFPDGRSGSTLNLPLTARVDRANAPNQLSGSLSGDARWNVQIGWDIASGHGIPRADRWHLNFWPPGMYLYWAALFTVFGLDIPVGVTAGIALAVLLAAALTLYAELLSRYLRLWVVASAIGLVVFSDLIAEGICCQNLLLSEGLYVWWMLVTLYATLRLALARSQKARVGWALASGAALGGSAYIRVTSELLGRVFTMLVVVWIVVVVAQRAFQSMRSPRSQISIPSSAWSRNLIGLILVVAAFQAVTIPWRIIAAQTIRSGDYSWTVATNRYWHMQWTPDSIYAANNLGWMADGGSNTACRIEPVECRTAYRNPQTSPIGIPPKVESRLRDRTFESIANHPWEWAQRQLRFPLRAWFGAPIPCGYGYQYPTCKTTPGFAGSANEIPQNALFLVALVAALGLSIRRIRRWGADLLALLIPSLLIVTAAPLVLLVWEPRYFLPIKLLSVLAIPALIIADQAPDIVDSTQLERIDRLGSVGLEPSRIET